MRTTIDFPIIDFALRCGGKRPARLAAGALRKLAMPIKEACMTPAVKRSLYRHVAMLLDLRK